MIGPARKEFAAVTRLAIELDQAIAEYASAVRAEAAAIYAKTGKPFAPGLESWRQQVRAMIQERRTLAAVVRT